MASVARIAPPAFCSLLRRFYGDWMSVCMPIEIKFNNQPSGLVALSASASLPMTL
jgi:hypothetical protein